MLPPNEGEKRDKADCFAARPPRAHDPQHGKQATLKQYSRLLKEGNAAVPFERVSLMPPLPPLASTWRCECAMLATTEGGNATRGFTLPRDLDATVGSPSGAAFLLCRARTPRHLGPPVTPKENTLCHASLTVSRGAFNEGQPSRQHMNTSRSFGIACGAKSFPRHDR
jgi:hypothetical protein